MAPGISLVFLFFKHDENTSEFEPKMTYKVKSVDTNDCSSHAHFFFFAKLVSFGNC